MVLVGIAGSTEIAGSVGGKRGNVTWMNSTCCWVIAWCAFMTPCSACIAIWMEAVVVSVGCVGNRWCRVEWSMLVGIVGVRLVTAASATAAAPVAAGGLVGTGTGLVGVRPAGSTETSSGAASGNRCNATRMNSTCCWAIAWCAPMTPCSACIAIWMEAVVVSVGCCVGN